MKHIAVVFAGGVGNRMGSEVPKQFLDVNGKTILIHTLEVFEQSMLVDGIVLACREEWVGYTEKLIAKDGLKKVFSVIPGGETALDSQYLALCKVRELFPNEEVIVLIHDGVRPLLDQETIVDCLESVNKFGNAITSVKSTETVVMVGEGKRISGILNREGCYLARAPQCFRLNDILALHDQSIREGNHSYIDSASMAMAHGVSLHIVVGKPENIKVTTPLDYQTLLGVMSSDANP